MAELTTVTKAIPIPPHLCFGRTDERIEPGEHIMVLREVGRDKLEVLTLAGPLIVPSDCVALSATRKARKE